MTSNVVPLRPAAERAAADFYDRTIALAWRLATVLYPGQQRTAEDAVVHAYRRAWAAPAERDQRGVLLALVADFREHTGPVPA